MSQDQPTDPQQPETFTQNFQYSQVSARVPEKVASGVHASGVLVLNAPNEFIIDFIQQMVQPPKVASRVVVNPQTMASFIRALEENLGAFEQRFGAPKPLPGPPPGVKPTPIDELYSQLKLPDEMLGGTYSNGVMITHNPSDFVFDFIATFYPRSVVASRVFMSCQQVPGFLSTIKKALQQLIEKQVPAPTPPKIPPQGAN
jgi:hypothetical protein